MLSLAGCKMGPARPPLGIILISVDTLRADHLGAYGYGRPTSPFFDALAARGTLFENAVVQVASTLPSHMSIFTGLYPAEHGVYPPDGLLAPAIPTLPEVLSRHGFRTGAVTQGGWLEEHFGFNRGCDFFEALLPWEMVDERPEKRGALRKVFDRGLGYLAGVGDAPFFLFLHTFTVHDPYTPPEGYAKIFWTRPAPAVFPPEGKLLEEVNRGTRTLSPEGLEYFKALYDAQIRFFDDELRAFFGGLERLGLLSRTVVVLTADHGEEFLEHGKLVHEQLYQETVHVPLLVVTPLYKPGQRVPSLVESVDLAPTLLELAGVPPSQRPRLSGRSLVPLLEDKAARVRSEAYAEHFVSRDRTLYQETADGVFQLVRREPLPEGTGYWVTRSLTFDAAPAPLFFRAFSYARPRAIHLSINGRPKRVLQLDTVPRHFKVALAPGGSRRITLSAADCLSPSEDGKGDDTRCLSFWLGGVEPVLNQLYDLTRDSRGVKDVSRHQGRLLDEMKSRLARYRWEVVASPGKAMPDESTQERLRALGYLE